MTSLSTYDQIMLNDPVWRLCAYCKKRQVVRRKKYARHLERVHGIERKAY